MMSNRFTNGGRRGWRSGRMSLAVFRVCLAGCAAPAAQAATEAAAAYVPVRHEVVIGPAERRAAVLSGFLTGAGAADLVTVQESAGGARLLRVFSFVDGAWRPALEASLRSEVAFVDVANLDGRERLIVYGAGRLSWFDVETGREQALMDLTADIEPPPGGGVLHVDVTRDLNGDGRDDLVLPQGQGFQVLVQTAGGRFADAVGIGPTTGAGGVCGSADAGYRCRPWDDGGRVHEIDYDRDGRNDLAFWAGDRFKVHLQDEHGTFAVAPLEFTTDVSFDSDEIASLAAPTGIRGRRRDRMPAGASTGRVLHSMSDVNGDGVADLVVFALDGSSLWKMRSSHEVYFGVPGADGGTDFPPAPGAVLESTGILAGIDRSDFDGDGQIDVMLTSFRPTVLRAIRVLVQSILTGSGAFDLEFYRMRGGRYVSRPDAVREIRPKAGRKTGDRTFFPAVLVGDVNGDGRADLLVQRNLRKLQVYLGVPGPDLFTRRPRRIAVAMPRGEEHMWLADLNRDGRQDVLMHHASSSPASTNGQQRVTILMSGPAATDTQPLL